jgi:rhomboid protease GluP
MDFITILIAINAFIFILPYIADFSRGMLDSNTAFLMQFWQDDRAVRNGEWYRLISSQFLHGNFIHIAFNMYTLWQVRFFAYNMHAMVGLTASARIFTPLIFLFVYLTSGLAGNLLSLTFGSGIPSLGASGAILGIFGFMTAFFLYKGDTVNLNNMLLNIGILAVMGFLLPNIDNYAHAGGFVAGFGLFYALLSFVQIILKA